MANNKVEPQKENEINVLSDSVPCEARQETILAVLRQRYFSTSDSVLAVRLGVDKGILKRYVDRKRGATKNRPTPFGIVSKVIMALNRKSCSMRALCWTCL